MLGGRRRWLLLGLVAIGLGQAAAAVATALLVEAAFEDLLAGARPAPLGQGGRLGLGLLAAVAAGAALRGLERVQAERLGQDYVYRVRLALYDRLVTLAPRSLQRRSQGVVALRFVGDVTALRQWVSLGLARLAVGGTLVGGALAAMALLSPALAGALAVVLALGCGVAGLLGGPLRRAARELRRRRGRLAANVGQQVGAVGVVQVFGQADRERRKLKRQGRALRDASVRRARVAGGVLAATDATAGLATAAVLLVGAGEVAAGRIGPGTVVAAMAIVGVLVAPLRDLGRVWEYRQNARVAQDRLEDFLALPSLVEERPGAPDLKPGPGRLVFEGAGVGGWLAEVSAAAAAGERVAIVGPNGAGKSTLLHLAARLLDPERGRVLLDGQDLRAHSLASVRQVLGIAGPDLPLLRGSLGRNLRYRRPRATPKETARVWALTGVADLLRELPEGERTRVAEDGRGLSAGQRARVALARALLGDPTVLLLDEADANLDPRAAAAFDRVVAEFPGTLLLVTHRWERAAAMDQVWHLEGGRLVERGPPAALLAGDGPTARLFAPAPPTADDPGAAPAEDPALTAAHA